MIEKFWEKIGENLAGQWDLQRLGPALAFWAGGLVLWTMQGNLDVFSGLFHMTAVQAGIVIIIVLAIVVLSNLAVASLTLPTLRLLEGYWTPWPFNTASRLGRIWPFRFLETALTKRMQDRWNERFNQEYQELAGRYQNLDSIQAQRYAHLDAELLTAYPKQSQLFLPTRIGNLLRATEEYPQYWYGLQTAITWPRLWLVLPESVQKEIAEARQGLDKAVTWLLWAILFAAWVKLSIWAVVISILAAFLFVRSVYSSAQVYGQLVRSAYDLHRFDLYKSLGWPAPAAPKDEQKYGEEITQFLHRHQAPKDITYQR